MSIILSILRLLLAFAVVTLAGGAQAGAARPAAVAIELHYDGRILGTPVLTAAWDRPVSMKVDRPGGYAIGLTLHRTRIGDAPAVEVATTVEVEQGGRWTQVAAPSLRIGCSGKGSVDVDGRADAVRPFRLAIAIDPAAIDPGCTRG